MHAVLVKVSISDVEASQQELRETVVPRVSQLPGFVAGWRHVRECRSARGGRERIGCRFGAHFRESYTSVA